MRRRSIAQIGERVAELQREILVFQARYELPYEQFYAHITTDDDFVSRLRETHPTW
ncbi:MAG: hypothetical protein Fur0044_13140 [Anaerolineae bacterium]|nr:hypothetical protein [Anaerolineales bacterium]